MDTKLPVLTVDWDVETSICFRGNFEDCSAMLGFTYPRVPLGKARASALLPFAMC